VNDLQKALFEFARNADHLNQELRQLPSTHPEIETIFSLQDYLSVIARKAERVASIVGQEVTA
jgi:hypothetical protein